MKRLCLCFAILSVLGCQPHLYSKNMASSCTQLPASTQPYLLQFKLAAHSPTQHAHGRLKWHYIDSGHSILDIMGPLGTQIAKLEITPQYTHLSQGKTQRQYQAGPLTLSMDRLQLNLDPQALQQQILGQIFSPNQSINTGALMTKGQQCFQQMRWPRLIHWQDSADHTLKLVLIKAQHAPPDALHAQHH